MDEILLDHVRKGLDQLVILGAGMDSRPYRFADVLADVAIFELDHPASARLKRQALRRCYGQLPSDVHYIQVDLNGRRVAETLERHGFEEQLPTLFVWSGVSGYLSIDAVDAVLEDVAGLSRASIVFDYWHAAVARGDLTAYGARQAATRAADMGEPYRSGIDPRDLQRYVEARGLRLVDDLGPQQLRERYLIRSDGRAHGRPYEFLSIAYAVSAHCAT